MHHNLQPLPVLDSWAPSWPDLYAFAHPDPWLAYPYAPHRRPHPHYHHPAAGPSTFKPLPPHYQPYGHTRPLPLRAEMPPALPALSISLPTPALEPSPISPSDPGSPMSTAAPPTPAPEFLHVVCNAPLLAPKPLPYRPPAFLDSFELPDPDEDLSHPPYIRSSPKRKRSRDGQDDPATSYVSKRRATETVFRGLNGLQSQRRFSK